MRTLHTPRGESFAFDGGAVVVDFAFTGGDGPYAVFETLHEPHHLAAWLSEPPLDLPASLAVSEDELRAAKRLRSHFFVLLQALAHGGVPPRAAVAAVNKAAAVPPLAPRLGAAGGRSTRRWVAPVGVEAVLSTLARELIDVATGPRAERVRECAGDNCALVFVDTSRSGARRWCSMERCGNRNKVRAYRDRDRGRTTDP
jgi:predicted RNA-binding Zn ribbon-like protein